MKFCTRILIQCIITTIFFLLLSIELDLESTQLVLLISFAECVFISCIFGRFFNIYQIFLLMVLFFSLSIPLFNILGLYEYPIDYMFMYNQSIRVPIDEDVVIHAYKIYTVFLLGTSLGWLIYDRDFEKANTLPALSLKYWRDKKILMQLFLIILPLEIIFAFLLVLFSIKNGYISTIHLRTNWNEIGKFLAIVDYIYPLIGYMTLFRCRDKIQYIKTSILFVLPYLITIFAGQRGPALSIVLSLIFIYSYYFKQISHRTAMVVFMIFMSLIIGIGIFRWSWNMQDFASVFSINFARSVCDAFIGNSLSICVLPYTMQLIDSFTNKVPFIFGYPAAIFSFASNYTVEGILSKSYLAQHVTFLLNPSKLLRGSTIGTSMIAEFYEFSYGNIYIILFMSIILLFITMWFLHNLYKHELIFIIGIMYIQQFFLSPRGSVFKIFNKLTLMYILILIIYRLIVCKKNNAT